ncbi:MAG: magnesium transporter CorA family protein [Chloroflexi bacterium]|nr:magnesium transporter CorA family protein [Chloroflexota bacterium]
MIKILQTRSEKLVPIEEISDGAWINVVNPSETEIERLLAWGIPKDFITYPLDLDERSRTEKDDGYTLILLRIPFYQSWDEDIPYITIPLGIIFTDQVIVTICRYENDLINNILSKNGKYFSTVKRNRFILQIMLANANYFLSYLRSIQKLIDRIEDELQRSIRNKEVLELLKYQKCLEYFSTALRSNEIMFERLQRNKFFTIFPDDSDLLDDVIIENQQAIEMTGIAGNLLSQMMDAYASIIQNNQNIIFKIMTAWTIILSLPSIVSGFFGMNVRLPFESHVSAFSILAGISVTIMLAVVIFFKKINWL